VSQLPFAEYAIAVHPDGLVVLDGADPISCLAT
jgi:hypothetical protein